jgi:hypothetical protein
MKVAIAAVVPSEPEPLPLRTIRRLPGVTG